MVSAKDDGMMSSSIEPMVSQVQQAKEFQCPVCQKFFSRKFSLEMHLLIHKGVKPHACPFCGRCFRQKGTLMRHKALHSNTALFQCGLCNKSYRQKNVFLHHLKHTHKVSTENLDRRKCRSQAPEHTAFAGPLSNFADSCSAVADPATSVSEQPCTVVLGAPKTPAKSHWTCNICSATMEFEQAACSYHLSLHKTDYPFECFRCCILFAKRSDLNVHLTECHLEGHPDTTSSLHDLQLFYGNFQGYEQGRSANPDSSTSDVTFTCIPCQLDFHSEEDFECHVKTHVQSVLCDSSDGESVKSATDRHHSSAITSSSSAAPLEFVPHGLKSDESIQSGGTPLDLLNAVVAGTHTVLEALSNIDSSETQATLPLGDPSTASLCKGEMVRLYCCPFCDESFRSKETLRRHSSRHLGDTVPRCAVPGERLYPCSRCPKRFTSRVLCEYHLQMHLEVRPFRCSLCRWTFSHKTRLLEHTRQCHMKARSCRECGRRFQYGALLRGHLRHCPGEASSSVRAPVIDLSRLDCNQTKSILGVIPLKRSGSSASYGIPVVAPGQVGRLSLMLPVIGSVSLSPAHPFRKGSSF